MSEVKVPPGCKLCGKPVNFDRNRPFTFCSRSCATKFSRSSLKSNAKREATCLAKYGVKNPLSNAAIRANAAKAFKEKYHENDSIKQKRIATSQKKYGADTFFGSETGKQKIKDCIRDKYGVDNVKQLEEVKRKAKETFRKNHPEGSENFNNHKKKLQDLQWKKKAVINWRSNLDFILLELLDGESPVFLAKKYNVAFSTIYQYIQKTEYLKYIVNSNINISAPHRKILSFLDSIGISYRINARDVIAPKELDIFIESKKIAIEINGLFWHSDNFLDKKYHLNKTKLCEAKGIRLYHFTDEEILFKWDIVKSMLNVALGYISTKIPARKCTIKTVDNKTYELFCKENHLLGPGVASIRLGLFFKDSLVSVMSFSKSRYDKTYNWEMIRFCSKNDTIVMGAASKLFKHFCKSYNNRVISYSNRRYSQGNLYEKLGFTFLRYSPPSYMYTDGVSTYSRYQCQKHKLKKLLRKGFDEHSSEEDNMIRNGFMKVWDCGNKVYGIEEMSPLSVS